MMADEDLFESLREMSKKVLLNDINISGVKFIFFYNDGKLIEYNTRNDKTINGGGY